MKRIYASLAVLLAICTTATVALAFSRNLSGSWTTPNGHLVAVVHNTSTSQAIFSFPNLTSNLPVTSIDFQGAITGEDGSTRFTFQGGAQDVAFRKGDVTCTLSDLILGAQGQVLGQFPDRTIHMTRCGVMGSIKCESDNGQSKEDVIVNDCSGMWR